MHIQGLRFNNINNFYYFIEATLFTWVAMKNAMALVQLGVTTSIPIKVPAILPITTPAPSVQMSTAKKLMPYSDNSFNPEDPLENCSTDKYFSWTRLLSDGSSSRQSVPPVFCNKPITICSNVLEVHTKAKILQNPSDEFSSETQ